MSSDNSNNSASGSQHHVNYILETFEDRDRLYTQFELFYPAFEKKFPQALELAKIDPDKQKFRVLDAGCGEGLYVDAIAKKYPNATVIGFDRDVEGITTANMIFAQNPQLHFYVQDMTQPISEEILTDHITGQKPALFDVIFAVISIVHNKEPLKILQNLAQALRPGGVLYLCETVPSLMTYPDPNYRSLMNYVTEAGSRVAAVDFPHQHGEYLKQAGFEPGETVRVEYPIGGPTHLGKQMLRNLATVVQNTRRGVVFFGLLTAEDFDRRMTLFKDEIDPDVVGTWTNMHTMGVKI